MQTRDVLADAFGRIRTSVHRVVNGSSPAHLALRVDPDANSIAWLVWHLTRVIDDHVSDLAGVEQTWTSRGWVDRFGLPFEPDDIGYGHTSEEVGRVRADDELLLGYHDAVHSAVLAYLEAVDAAELDRVVDERWEPPVTAGVRIVSVINDATQHVGQAAFVLGVAKRTAGR